MIRFREIKPELDEIKDKYGKTKDPEKIKKMNAERTALMAKHGANPLSGCLPMLFTFFNLLMLFSFFFISRRAFAYITHLRLAYYDLSQKLIDVPYILDPGGPLREMGNRFIPDNFHLKFKASKCFLVFT